MSPEAIDYLGAAERALDRAKRIAEAGVYDTAAREAYTAALNAARAIVFDKMHVAAKTHSGVRTLLFDLIRQGLDLDAEHAAFLRDAFQVKLTVDYDVEPANVDQASVFKFMERATAFIAAARRVLG